MKNNKPIKGKNIKTNHVYYSELYDLIFHVEYRLNHGNGVMSFYGKTFNDSVLSVTCNKNEDIYILHLGEL